MTIPTIAPVDSLLGFLSLSLWTDMSMSTAPPNADWHVTTPAVIFLTLPDQHSTFVELNEI